MVSLFYLYNKIETPIGDKIFSSYTLCYYSTKRMCYNITVSYGKTHIVTIGEKERCQQKR